jgi:hypothetical protein
MANTHNQELEKFIFTDIDSQMDHLKMELKKDLNYHLASQLESHIEYQIDSFVAKVLEKLPIFGIHSSSDQPSHLEGTTSSNSQHFQSNHCHCDLCLPHMEVKKLDGSNPTSWVTQMEHYSPCMASLMTRPNFVTMSSIWILNIGNGGNGIANHSKDMKLGPSLWLNFMTTLTLIHSPWTV